MLKRFFVWLTPIMHRDNAVRSVAVHEYNNIFGLSVPRYSQSYGIYQRVLDLEPDNSSAQKSLEQLRSQLGELAPAHATRMTIEEHQPQQVSGDKGKEKPKSVPKPMPKSVKPVKEYDLAELVKPNRVVKSKLVSAAEALGGKIKGGNPGDNPQGKHLLPMVQGMPTKQTEPAIRLPQLNNVNNSKILIQEL